MEKVSRYLEQRVEPCSRNQVEQNVKGKTGYKRQAIDALIDEGYAIEVQRRTKPPSEVSDAVPRGRRAVTSPHLAPSSPLPQLLDAKNLAAELGVTRAAAEAIMRQLPTCNCPTCERSTSGVPDVHALLERCTFAKDQVPAA